MALTVAACGQDNETSAPEPEPSPENRSQAGSAIDEPDQTDVPAALDLAAADLDGTQFDPSTVEGTVVVLWFWAPWCTTCRAEAPNVVEVSENFEGEAEIIGVAGRGETPEMEQFVKDTGTHDLRHLVDPDGAIWSQFEVISQPAFAFIDTDGEVRDVFIGPLGNEGLTDRLDPLVKG